MDIALALIRHGEYAQPEGVPSAHLPHPLIEAGRGQARAGCAALVRAAEEGGWELDPVIDASPLLRAWETAEIFAAGLGARVETFEALTERSLGSAANLTIAEIEAVIARDPRREPLPSGWRRRSDFRLPLVGAESLIESGVRVAAHLELRAGELARERAGGDGVYAKLVVGHGGSLRHGAAELGILSLDEVAGLSMFHAQPVVFVHRGGRWEHLHGAWKHRGAAADLH